MPIMASQGALTYARTNLGDPNFTYWMLNATGVTGALKGMYVDSVNGFVYVQSLTSTGPNLTKINGLVGPTMGYNTTYTITFPTGTGYGSMGYMGYNPSTSEFIIPVDWRAPNTVGAPYIVGYPVLIYANASTGALTNDYRRRTFNTTVPADNRIYTNMYQAVVNSAGDLYTCHTSIDITNNAYAPQAIRYPNAVPTNPFNGAININPNPYTSSIFNTIGNMIFDSSNNSICSVMVYGTTLNEVRWYTNGTTAGGGGLLPLNNIAQSVYTLTGKRLEAGGLALDSSDNRIGVIFNATDNNSFIVKTNSSHTLTWQKAIAGVKLYNIAVDSSNNIYVSGLVAANNRIYVAKFDSSGNEVWQRQIYGQEAYGIPNIYCDSISIIISCSTSSNNPFIARLPNDGSKTGTYVLGSTNITYASISQSVSNGTLTAGTPVTTVGGTCEAYGLPITVNTSTGSNSSVRTLIN